ncbi:protein FAR-RED ELONGATED HYPOCOTYL 3-like [Juglans regia]|uniref:Protein FAR-RED ELONGATED HYPOCOTYL 3-like n=1 Tax=Juglans regia TaxID=51240 RepID=A0A6P9EMK9_JUGRE|nr:protein FAR-RED ELONGATED HYPOCOTYL 3-like [Juglans regia]
MNKMEESGKSNLVEPTTYTRRSLFSEDELLEPTTGSNAEDEILEPTSGCNDDEGMLEPTSGCNDDEEVSKPTTGMVFKTEVELIKYYKKYGKQTGFGIMTQRSRRTQDESVKYITFGCASGGKARNCSINLVKPRLTTKTECKARINAVLRQLDLVVEAGGFDKLPFIEKDARNYIDKARHLRLGKGGVVALRDYFVRMQYKNEGFYSLMDLDDDGKLKNIFRTDAQSRATYGYFGDVVNFDTTYLTNR